MGRGEPRDATRIPTGPAGDVNGFFGLVVDNLSILAFIATVLIGVYGFPAEVVYQRMFPGTALGVLVGNALYTWMALRLGRREGRSDVTAMPLGLDAPTSIGMALLVLGPSYAAYTQGGLDATEAALRSWRLGMASLVVMGALKLLLSFAGDWAGRAVPRAALLGSIAGIALMLIGLLPLVEILRVPIAGFVGVGLVLALLLGRNRLARAPAVVVALVVAAALYFTLGPLGLLGNAYHAAPAFSLQPAIPWPTLGFVAGLPDTVPYLPLLLPFGLLMVVGGINVSESARAAGDDFRTRDILLVEAGATLVAGVFGGVAQTTPYIGQPAYKAMGARHAYALATGLFIGIGGMLGVLGAIIEALPLAILAPILVYVAIGITMQAFEATPRRYAAAVVFSFFPAIARLLAIKLGDPTLIAPDRYASLYGDVSRGPSELFTIVVLGNGFILTSMIWAAFLVAVIDARPWRASGVLVLGAAMTAFGLIHSVQPDGSLYLPWLLSGAGRQAALQWSAGYLALAVLVPLLLASGARTAER
jgi:AGZA family xanthine/uracil permease-like MFS transporter